MSSTAAVTTQCRQDWRVHRGSGDHHSADARASGCAEAGGATTAAQRQARAVHLRQTSVRTIDPRPHLVHMVNTVHRAMFLIEQPSLTGVVSVYNFPHLRSMPRKSRGHLASFDCETCLEEVVQQGALQSFRVAGAGKALLQHRLAHAPQAAGDPCACMLRAGPGQGSGEDSS